MRRLRMLVLALPGALLATAAGTAVAADPPTTVTIVAPQKVFSAGTGLDVKVEVRNGNNAAIFMKVKIGNQTIDLNCGGTVADADDFFCHLDLYWNTRFIVTVNGSDAAHRDFAVRPVMGSQLKTGHAQAGKYAVMSRGASPKFVSISSPARPGKMCLRHEVEAYRAQKWTRVVRTGCRTESDKGTVTWTWAGTHPSRVAFRIRATFAGDQLNVAGPGRWSYFRFR